MRDQALFDTVGSDKAWALVKQSFKTIRTCTEAHSGTLIKTITMNKALCVFPDALSALQAAINVGERLRKLDNPIPIAVGLDHGAVLHDEGDIFGHVVNAAARILDIAKADQILASRAVLDAFNRTDELDARPYEHVEVKGIEEPLDVWEILRPDEDTTDTRYSPPAPRAAARIKLTYGSEERLLGGGEITIGRGDTADIHIDEPLASRTHIRIVHQKGKFILTDHSINGTYVEIDGVVSHLRRLEVAILVGGGRISLGRPFDNARAVIYFECFND